MKENPNEFVRSWLMAGDDDDGYGEDELAGPDHPLDQESRLLAHEEEDCAGPSQALRRPSTSRFDRIRSSVGLKRKRSTDIEEYDLDVPILGSSPAVQATRLARQRRRFRRSKVTQFIRSLIGRLPILILAIFGIVHILEALFGRTKLLWTAELRIQATSRNGRQLPGGVNKWPVPAPADGADVTRGVVPIPCHSHNDYWRDVPLYDALRWGCTGVEADIWLFDNQLYVGHTASALDESQTLESMYIQPLIDLLGKKPSSSSNSTVCDGQGVFATAPEQTLVLLLDLKTPGAETFEAAQRSLQKLREMGCLSFWDGQKFNSRELTIVGTGETPFEQIVANETYRDIFFDAPLHALWERPREPISKTDPLHVKDKDVDYGTAMALSQHDSSDALEFDRLEDIPVDSFDTSVSYYASTSFFKSVGYVWRGHLSPRQMGILRGQIRGAKRRGLKVRYWEIPAWPTSLRNHVWHVLVKEGADVLNVDDLAAAALADWTVPVHDTWFGL